MNILTIDKNEFQKGVTLDDDDEAGGMSPDGNGLNYFLSKGFTLIPQPSFTTVNGTVGEIVDSCVDSAYLGDDCLVVDNAGKFYILSGTTLSLKKTDSAGSYAYPTSRIKAFKGGIYCTTNNDITFLNGTMGSMTVNWWTVTKSKTALHIAYRHPMEVVEDTMYIADNNMLHTWDGTTAVYNAMSLPSQYNITELRISNDGRHLLAFVSETANSSHAKKTVARIFVIDTVTLEFIQEIKVADQTESAINIAGTTYVIYGKSFGYFTGSGYKLIRRLESTNAIYPPRVTTVDNTILIVEDNRILVFGNISGKGNIFFYLAKSESPYNPIRNILAYGNSGNDDNKLLLNYVESGSNKARILDLNDRGSYDIDVLTKKYRKGKVWIRRVEVETETLASGDSLTLSTVNEDGTYNEIGTFSYALNGAVQKGRFDCNHLVDFIQLRLQWANFGIKKLTIYYESGE